MQNGDCKRKRRVIASFITNSNDPDRTTWDLTPYQSAGRGTPGGSWRLIEAGYGDVYAHGKIASDGTLVSSDFVESPSGINEAARSSSNGDGRMREDNAGTPTPSGVPDEFDKSCDYDGYMELEVEEPEEPCQCPELEDCCEKC